MPSQPPPSSNTDFLRVAFAAAPRPAASAIVGHACPECFELRDDFAHYTTWSLPVETIHEHFGDLSLLTPEAFRYFLPAYVAIALSPAGDPVDEQVCEFLLYSLYPAGELSDPEFHEARFRTFSPPEREAVVRSLRSIAADPRQEYSREEALKALEWWSSRIRGDDQSTGGAA